MLPLKRFPQTGAALMYVTSSIRALIGSLPSFLAELGVPTARLRGRHLRDRFSSSSVSAVHILSLLSLLIVGSVLLCGITGIGTGVSETTALSSNAAVDADASIQPAVLESTSQRSAGPDTREEPLSRSVAFSQPDADTPDENDVVVRLEDDHVVTAAVADRMPSDPYVTVGGPDGEPLVVGEHSKYDYPVVQTEAGRIAKVDGRPISRIDNETDLVVLSDSGSIDHTIVVDRDDGGLLKTANGDYTVRVDGTDVVSYNAYDETDIELEIRNVSSVDEGETLRVEATFENSEWGADDHNVDLRLIDSGTTHRSVEGSRSVEIGSGEQVTKTFEFDTKRGDHVADEIEVDVSDDSDTADVSIGAAGAAVVDLETRGTVEGNALKVTAHLDRFGTVPEGAQDYPITLSINGTEVRTNVVTLSPGATTTETLTYETDRDDVPEVDVRVSSPTDSASTTVPVVSRLEHDQNIRTEVTDTTIGGFSDEFDVSAVFWYSGDLPGGETQFTANLTADGTVVDQQNITLTGSSAANATFSHELSESAPPIANATIETPAGVAPVEFEQETVITFDEITDPAARNGQLTATVTVENRGETPGKETLTIEARNPYAVESDGTYTASAPLEPSESFTETVTFDVTEDAPPNLDLVASTTHASEVRTVEIRNNESRFEIENVSVNAGAGSENPAVTATIRNIGGAAGTQDVMLTFDGQPIATESISLEPDEKRTLSGAVEPAETGTYSYGVTTDDDSVRDTTTVEPTDDSSGIVGSVQDTVSLNGSRLPLLAASLLGVVLVGAAVVRYRSDSDDLQELQERMTGMTALQPAARKLQQAARNARNLVSNGGSGSVVVQNDLPRTALIRVRVRSDEEILFLEDFELAEDEQRTLECLPDADQFEVGAGVDDIAAHEETFQRGTDEVGIVLQPDGITITAL